MQEFPGWVVTSMGIASIFLILACIAIVAIGVVSVGILLAIKEMVTQDLRKEIMPSLASTMKNVDRMSHDAADTTHNVTSAANRVANLVGSAANRIESPLIKAVGIGSGLLAAGRAIRGGDKKPTIIVEKKRGFRGK